MAGYVVRNDVHIAMHEAKADPVAPHEHTVTLAFDHLALPVLVTKLQSSETPIILNALRATNRLLPTSMNVVKAVEAKMVPELVNLCSHSDGTVRQKAALGLTYIMRHPAGKVAICDSGALTDLEPVLRDPSSTIRQSILTGIEGVAAAMENTRKLVAAGWVKVLTGQALEDKDAACRVTALRALSKMLSYHGGSGQKAAVDGGSCAGMIKLLGHEDAGVREWAGKTLGYITFDDAGKKQAIDGEAVPVLLKLCRDPSDRVRVGATSALMGITVDNKGKEAVIAAGVDDLIATISDSSDLVILNGMRAVASVSAHPKGREALSKGGVLKPLDAVAERGAGRLSESAVTTAKVVRWKP